MKPYLVDLVRSAASNPAPFQARNLVREYLQARILQSLQRHGAMIPLAFHGGTALRFLYGSQRFSEDLDFTLERPSSQYDFRAYLEAIRDDLAPEGYAIELKVSDRRVVHNAFVRFGGLWHELGLSPHPGEVVAVKLEVDTNPPQGTTLVTTVVRRHVTLNLQHHDRASLLAEKLHAILQRPYVKGRDVYDLIWYLGDRDWPGPNLNLLNNALRQSGWTGDTVTEQTWRSVVRERVTAFNWEALVHDVRSFIESEAQLSLLQRDIALNLLR